MNSLTILAHITDAHVAPRGAPKATLKHRSVPLLEDFVEQIRARGDVDATLFGGDNIDNDGDGPADLAMLAVIAERVGRYLVIVGNHEAPGEASGAARPGVVSKEAFAAALAGHGIRPGRYEWSEAVGDVRIIGIDTTEAGRAGGRASPATLDFARAEVTSAREPFVVVLGHHLAVPVWGDHRLPEWDEDYLCRNGAELLSALEAAGRPCVYLCGHHHVARVLRVGKNVVQVASPSPIAYPLGVRLLRFEASTLTMTIETLRPSDPALIEEGRAAVATGRKARRYGAIGATEPFETYCTGAPEDLCATIAL